MDMNVGPNEGPILHVVVVGFHHKKGCQVEYAYPPLVADKPGEDAAALPSEWKNLPSLALPDGAHNFIKDTVYFHLPSREDGQGTVFGVSCYRQIEASKLRHRDSDVTRNTVQKSVCVLSKLPLYGLIQAKLELITHAYFKELDFSQVGLLEETYKNLNHGLTESLMQGTQLFLGLSVRNLVQLFQHKALVLFKLLLLEKRVLVFGSPALQVSSMVLTLVSLIPGMLESGVADCANYSRRKPILRVSSLDSGDGEDYVEVIYNQTPPKHASGTSGNKDSVGTEPSTRVETPKIVVVPSAHSSTGASSNISHRHQRAFTRSMSHGPRVENSLCDNSGCDSKNLNHVKHHASTLTSSKMTECFVHALPHERRDRSSSLHNKHSGASFTVGNQFSVTDNADNIDIGSITHIEPVQMASSSSVSDETMLQRSRHESNDNKADPLQYVEDVTSLQRVQVSCSDLQDGVVISPEERTKTGLLQKAMSVSSQDSDLTRQEQQMLDEDCFNWEEDKLLLEINEVIEGTCTPTYKHSGNVSPQSTDDMPVVHTQQPLPSNSECNDSLLNALPGTDNRLGIYRSESGASLSSRGSSSRSIDCISAKASDIRAKLYEKLSVDVHDDKLLTKMTPPPPCSIVPDENGLPLAIFSKGMLLHPYLSLQFYDLLQEVNVRGFIIGASNILYKQKKTLVDVIVDVSEGSIEIHDAELRKQLDLSTADLRFADYLVKCVGVDSDEDANIFISDTGWEGGDDWLRSQFKSYLLSLCAVCQQQAFDQQEDFNSCFLSAWTSTSNYKLWHSTTHEGLCHVVPSHPCHGNLRISDMKLRISHSMNSTERGQKLNAAVAQTGRAVGVAMSSARSAVSSLFSVFGNSNASTRPS